MTYARYSGDNQREESNERMDQAATRHNKSIRKVVLEMIKNFINMYIEEVIVYEDCLEVVFIVKSIWLSGGIWGVHCD